MVILTNDALGKLADTYLSPTYIANDAPGKFAGTYLSPNLSNK
jgi:hypothetical protein